jgi:hypothetical protein
MNTNLLLLGAAILTGGVVSGFAGDVLLSPRAADNQIKYAPSEATMPATTATPAAAASTTTLSPRAADNQVVKVAGGSTQVNPAVTCAKNMTGSPKAIGACLENPKAMGPCLHSNTPPKK